MTEQYTTSRMSAVEDINMLEQKVRGEHPYRSAIISSLYIVLEGVLAWSFPIDLSENYDWMYAILHGLCAPFYWMSSFFGSDYQLVALFHSESYMLTWWISLVLGI